MLSNFFTYCLIRTTQILCPPFLSPLSLQAHSCRLGGLGTAFCSAALREKTEHKMLESSTAPAAGTKIQPLVHTQSPHSSFHAQQLRYFPFPSGDKNTVMYMTNGFPSERVLFTNWFLPWFLCSAQPSSASQAVAVLGPQFTATAQCVGMATFWDVPASACWWSHHPRVPHCSWVRNSISPGQSKLQHLTINLH